ncbi:MAG: ribonuclease P protein component [Planctomycetota bacterium]
MRLRPCDRIRGDARFQEIRRSGVRAGDDFLFVRALENDAGRSRLGLAVGRGAGRSVQRSRLRRAIREAFRLNRKDLPEGLDLLVSPRKGAAAASPEELGRSLVSLAGRTAAKLREPKGR